MSRDGAHSGPALEHLHSHNLVHRDIKPSNIIFINGTPRLADIGLVTGVDATRSYVGTEGYIPPEGAGTMQGDLFSLGKVLYEMGTGMDRNDFPEPPTFWQESAGESAWLEFHEVLLRACETDPRGRYQSAAELRAEVEVLRAGKSVRRLRMVERRLAVLTRLGLAASALLLLAAGAYFFSVHEARQARLEALRAERAEQQARERLWDSYLAQAQARRSSGWAGRRFDSLEAISNAVALGVHGESVLKLRNETIACVTLADFQTIKEWKGVPTNALLVAFDPTLERYAYATTQGDVSIRSVSDGNELLHLPGAGVQANAGFGFSPDAQLLALFHGVQDLDLTVWDLQRHTALLKTTGIRGRCFDFSPDSHLLALVQHDGPILIYDLCSGQCTNRLEQGPLPYAVAFSPDGRRLAVAVGDLAEVRELQTRAVLRKFDHPNMVLGLAWHPGGNLLATGCGDGKIRIWDTAEDSPRPCTVLAGHQTTVCGVAFDHRGDLLTSSSFDDTMRLWDTRNWRLTVTKPGVGLASRAPFNREDNRLDYTGLGGRLGLCQVAPGRECRQLWLDQELAEYTAAFDFSPDGRQLVSAHKDGARIWDLASEQPIGLVPETDLTCVGFGPKGGSLITSGERGLKRCPLDHSKPGDFHPGQSSFLLDRQPFSAFPFSLTPDGRALATCGQRYVLVLDAVTGRETTKIPHYEEFYRCALSPDHQWLAGARLPQTLVRIWNLAQTNSYHDLPCPGVSCLAFSPDSRQLITGSVDEYRAWEVPSWRCRFVAPRFGFAYNSFIAFSPNGQWVAITDSAFTLRLLEAATGRELARFGMPDPQLISCLAFSPDSTQLAVGGRTPVIYLWDLRLIRHELAEMKLDWE
jgi:WD40 repeat protein